MPPMLLRVSAVNQVQPLATLLDVLVKLQAACSQHSGRTACYSTDINVFAMLYFNVVELSSVRCTRLTWGTVVTRVTRLDAVPEYVLV